MQRLYQKSDVEEILTRAMALKAQRSETFSLEQLQEMAAELGIPAEDLQTAIADWEKEHSATASSGPGKAESAQDKPREEPFWRKAAPSAVILGGLLMMGPLSLLATIPLARRLSRLNTLNNRMGKA